MMRPGMHTGRLAAPTLNAASLWRQPLWRHRGGDYWWEDSPPSPPSQPSLWSFTGHSTHHELSFICKHSCAQSLYRYEGDNVGIIINIGIKVIYKLISLKLMQNSTSGLFCAIVHCKHLASQCWRYSVVIALSNPDWVLLQVRATIQTAVRNLSDTCLCLSRIQMSWEFVWFSEQLSHECMYQILIDAFKNNCATDYILFIWMVMRVFRIVCSYRICPLMSQKGQMKKVWIGFTCDCIE